MVRRVARVTQAECDSLGSMVRVAIVWACRTAEQMRKVRVRKQTLITCEREKLSRVSRVWLSLSQEQVQSESLPASLFWIIINNCISPQLLINSGKPTVRYQTGPVSVSPGDIGSCQVKHVFPIGAGEDRKRLISLVLTFIWWLEMQRTFYGTNISAEAKRSCTQVFFAADRSARRQRRG